VKFALTSFLFVPMATKPTSSGGPVLLYPENVTVPNNLFSIVPDWPLCASSMAVGWQMVYRPSCQFKPQQREIGI
jgi:hypothetical protein